MKAVFDERSINWTDNADYNIMYLRAKQNYFTDVLRARGHISLCEILDDTGITLDSSTVISGAMQKETGL